MIILPGQKPNDVGKSLETSGGKVDLPRLKDELRDIQTAGFDYMERLDHSQRWWQSIWEGQTVDGRKWWKYEDETDPFPWPGSSDTRVRLVKKMVRECRTICLYALMNMRMQAKSTRPAATIRESQQATTLLNWQIFTHMQSEWFRESELAITMAAVNGSSVISVDWEQERRLDYTPITVAQFGALILKLTGQNLSLLDLHDIIQGSDYEKELIAIIQAISEIITTSAARGILNDLRKDGQAEIPVPYLFRNKPRIMALRPMVDVFFSPDSDDLQRERLVDRVEYVTESVLTDRIETDNYDPGFVADAITKKGVYSQDVGYNAAIRNPYWFNEIRPGHRPDSSDVEGEHGLIELHHAHYYALDMGVPCLYRTVFHLDIDDAATHGIAEYQHGQMPYHSIVFERDSRPIIANMGIPEAIYTWENELKAQFDGRVDLASIKSAPPLFCDHSDVDKIAQKFRPHGLIESRPGRRPELPALPPYDPTSVQITAEIMERVREFYGWFGNDLDPELKQMRRMELVDRTTTQFSPVINQIGMLDDQFLTPDVWVRVTGMPPRQGIHDRASVQGQYEITMTCDLRELDTAFLKEKFAGINTVLPWDTLGVIDRSTIVRSALEMVDYTLADQAIRSTEQATQKEITDEVEKTSLIIASGVEQALPPAEGTNFPLRLQTLQNVLQSTPFIKQRVAQDPGALKALENRFLYFTRQIQQQKNAVIGRTQVGSANNPMQPPLMAPQGAPA